MEKPAFLDDLKVKFSALIDKIVAWIKDNKRLSIIIGALLILMLVCVIILISISANKNKKLKNYEEQLILTEELVIPNGPELPRDYTISRETQDKWTQEEGSQWFTVPSEKEINGLSKANDNLIDEILGAAP